MAELIVITGGAYAGKTSVVDAIAARGHEVLPEAAYEVIDELNRELGVDGQMAWRRANEGEFQRRISERQHGREVAARRSSSPFVFCDRGLLDGLAYCHLAGVPWSEGMHELAAPARYAHVFVLETLADFRPRRDSGRIDTRELSVHVTGLLHDVYVPQATHVTRIPEAPVEERVELVLDAAGLT